MSLIHPCAATCAVGELDLHALPISQKDILRSQFVKKTTNNALTDNTTCFDFTFEPSNLYTDLSEAELYLEYVIQANDEAALTVQHDAAPVNNLIHSLFSSVQLLINGEKVTSNNEEYSYKSYLIDLLTTEEGARKCRLQGCQNWFMDTPEKMDTRGAPNAGWNSRRTVHVGGIKSMVARPHLDLFTQCKLLPSHCEIKLVFERQPASFYMQMAANESYKVVIKKAEMTMRQVHVRDEVAEVHNKSVRDPKMGPFNYPITRSKVTKHTLTQGSSEYTWTVPDTTQIPTGVIIGFVKESASSGSKTENPFNFKHYDVTEVGLQFDDQKFHVKTDFVNGNVSRAYSQLFKETGLLASGHDCGIQLHHFKNGYTLFAFDLTPDRTPEDARINLLRQGKLSVSLKFAEALGHAVSVIMLSTYDSLIQLTADRLPVTDYAMV